MTTAFQQAATTSLADPNFGEDVVVTPVGGSPITVRGIFSTNDPDAVTLGQGAELHAPGWRLTLSQADVPVRPERGFVIVARGKTWATRGAARGDATDVFWDLDVYPSS